MRDGDEWIAAIVAFSTIGALLFWGMSRRDGDRRIVELPNVFPVGEQVEGDNEFLLTEPSPVERGVQSPTVIAPLRQDIETERPTTIERSRSVTVAPLVVPETEVAPEQSAQSNSAPSSPSPSVAEAPTTAPPVSEAPFADVPSSYWAAPFLVALSQRGVVTGLPGNTFEPNQPITRAEFATLLQQAFELKQNRSPISFNDVPADNWAANAVQEATGSTFMSGYPGNVFQPNQPITRQEVLVSIVTGLGLDASGANSNILQTFPDASAIAPWATDKMAIATQEGLVVNEAGDNQLKPQQPATRAEAAAMVYQALVAIGEAAPVDSNTVIRPE